MTRHAKFHVILAGAVALAACGGSNSVSNSQPNAGTAPEVGASATAGSAAPGASGSQGSATQAAQAAPAVPAGPVSRELSIPAGTPLLVELMTSLSSETSTVEQPVRARLTRDVVIEGYTAIPAGTILTGVVTEAERAGRVQGLSRLAFRFTVAYVRGTPERLRTNPVVYVGEESTKGDAARIGGGAVAGAVIGGLLGGGKGAAEGAAIGGGAGTAVVLATRGKDVEVKSGTAVTATLTDPLTVQAPL